MINKFGKKVNELLPAAETTMNSTCYNDKSIASEKLLVFKTLNRFFRDQKEYKNKNNLLLTAPDDPI